MLTLSIDSRPKLSSATFRLLRDLIYLKSGISFSDTKLYLLESRLSRRLEEKNLKTFEDYYYYLTYDADKDKELTRLLNCVVTNETSFFRDPVQLESFSTAVVPKVLETAAGTAGKTFRVWSAACSTGEEPYTIAMMLKEGNIECRCRVEVIGSDLSDNALKSAENAVYDRHSVRNTPEHFIKRYFTENNESFAVKKSVKDMVKIRKINLVASGDTRMVREANVIFLRNVLIYFDEASKKKAVGHIYDSLVKGGYLLVGSTETLHNVTRLFTPVKMDNTLVYQKL